MRVHHKKQLVTEAHGFCVSSINLTYVAGPYMHWQEDETTVFSDTWGSCLTVGSYDEHDKIVSMVKFLVENCDERDINRWGELGKFVISFMVDDCLPYYEVGKGGR